MNDSNQIYQPTPALAGVMQNVLESLWEEIDNLPISTNLEETRKYLDKILPAVKKEEESLFVTLFTAITSQSR